MSPPRLQLATTIGLGALAGLIAGALVAIMNSTILVPYGSNLADQWAGDLQDQGAFDEDEFNALLASIKLVDNTLFPIAAGIGMGALLSLTYLYVRRIRPAEQLQVTLLCAVAMWFVISVIPSLKYPPDAEATFDPGKSPTYYALLAAYTFVSAGAAVLSAKLFSRSNRKDRWLGAGALYLVIVAAASFAFPEIPHDDTLFPLQMLVPWRSAVAGEAGAFWLALGIISGLLFKFGLKQTKPVQIS